MAGGQGDHLAKGPLWLAVFSRKEWEVKWVPLWASLSVLGARARWVKPLLMGAIYFTPMPHLRAEAVTQPRSLPGQQAG